MPSPITPLDDYRPAAGRAVQAPGKRTLWSKLKGALGALYTPQPSVVAPNLVVPKAWPGPDRPARVFLTGRGHDDHILDAAIAHQLYLRTRGNHRARLIRRDFDDLNEIHPLSGAIELIDRHTGVVTWAPCGWFSAGGHTLYEHDWDLVSVETARCTECGCNDLHGCYETESAPSCHWLTVDRDTGLGVCSACAPKEAA